MKRVFNSHTHTNKSRLKKKKAPMKHSKETNKHKCTVVGIKRKKETTERPAQRGGWREQQDVPSF